MVFMLLFPAAQKRLPLLASVGTDSNYNVLRVTGAPSVSLKAPPQSHLPRAQTRGLLARLAHLIQQHEYLGIRVGLTGRRRVQQGFQVVQLPQGQVQWVAHLGFRVGHGGAPFC